MRKKRQSAFHKDALGSKGGIKRQWRRRKMLETKRLTIRRITPADYKEAFAWSGDARVNKYLLHNVLEKPEDMIPWLEGLDQSSKDSYITILHEKTDGHAVGIVGFFRDPETDIWSFAYNIRFDDWGKGYATEAARAIMDFVREKHGAHIFEAECAAENIASAKVMQHLGLTFDRKSTYAKHDGSVEFPSEIYRLEE